jgi:TIR domain
VSDFELPKNIERYLAALAKLYGQEGQRQMQEIIVNSQTRVHEEWSRDNWNGGTYGHALYLVMPEPLYLNSVNRKDKLRNEIRDDINKIHNVETEFIAEVFFEMEVAEDHDWRKESGLLLSRRSPVLPEAEKRIWGDEGFRVFLTHKADVKKQTSDLKERLRLFGISCFVAHEDIHPTREWQNEIENALFSMDALVALMTDTFHKSDWTDQEVGCAFGRGVPIIAVKLGTDPYGFIGKFQALSCGWETADIDIVKLLVKHQRMLNAYIKAVQTCGSYNKANTLSKILPNLASLSEQQANDLIAAFNENAQLRDSYGFNGTWAAVHGLGLAFHLTRLTGRTYEIRSGKIGIKT